MTLFAGKTLGFTACNIDNDNSIPKSRYERESMMGSVDLQGHRNDQGYINADAFGSVITRYLSQASGPATPDTH